jgi:hypothetical protein
LFSRHLRSFGFIYPEDPLEEISQLTRIDLAKLERSFFPRQVQHIPWKKPSISLPLDDFVELLAKRSRPPKLRVRSELAKIRPSCRCPYLLARTYSFIGVAKAEANCIATPRCWEAGKQVLDISQKIEKNIAEAIRDLQPLGYYGTTSIRALENACDILRNQAASIRSELKELPDRRGSPDIWKIAFAEALGFGWYLLTKRMPSAAAGEASFVHFVEAAYNSIEPENCESWESSIKTAIALVKQRPPNDRWNRWEFVTSEDVSSSRYYT